MLKAEVIESLDELGVGNEVEERLIARHSDLLAAHIITDIGAIDKGRALRYTGDSTAIT